MADTSSIKVSVAMAVYCGERFLTEQVESILVQLTMSDELVVAYNPSNDESLRILQSYAERDARVRIIENPRLGIVSNFNCAIENSTGDLILVSDQDDVWLPGKRNRLVEVFTNSEPDLIIHNGYHIDERGNRVSDSFFDMYGIGPGLVKNFLKPRYSGCCMAIKRESRVFLLPLPESVGAYDHWLGMAAEAFGSVVFLEDELLAHRLHDCNATTPRRSLPEVFASRFRLLLALEKQFFSNKSKNVLHEKNGNAFQN